jgi:hypothetical protein
MSCRARRPVANAIAAVIACVVAACGGGAEDVTGTDELLKPDTLTDGEYQAFTAGLVQDYVIQDPATGTWVLFVFGSSETTSSCHGGGTRRTSVTVVYGTAANGYNHSTSRTEQLTGCRFGEFTVDGGVTITEQYGSAGVHSGSESAFFTWTKDRRTGTCSMSLTMTSTPIPPLVRVTGHQCGRAIDFSR